jgi:hypothetical protein
MNCKRARTKIALFVGDDLDVAAKKDLKGHLSVCQPCRQYWQEMKTTLRALHNPWGDPGEGNPQPDKSLWPRLAARLPRRTPRQRQTPFNGWIAGGSVAAACCVLIAYAVTYQSPEPAPNLAVPATSFGLPLQGAPVSGGMFDSPQRYGTGPNVFEDDDSNSPRTRKWDPEHGWRE